ncbi:glutaredoxin family protein [Candidatus Parcubacteria bacterium]|nr:glutaredoxin family protein [Candidatus Parcubacteria bacterium]
MKKVQIYSTPTCHYCQMAKTFLKDNNVEYVEYNVAEDIEKREEMMKVSGQMGVPFIVIGEGEEEEGMIGFNEPKMRELLAL